MDQQRGTKCPGMVAQTVELTTDAFSTLFQFSNPAIEEFHLGLTISDLADPCFRQFVHTIGCRYSKPQKSLSHQVAVLAIEPDPALKDLTKSLHLVLIT